MKETARAVLACRYTSSAALSIRRYKINHLPSCSMLRYTLVLSGALLLFTSLSSSFAQEETETAPLVEETTPTGNVVNSKYLSIAEHRYRNGDFSDQITGIVVNNSTQEISGVSVDAALYDKDNRLITMAGAGFADVSTLPPGDDSAFSITLFGVEDSIDHYTLLPSGLP